MKKIYPPILKFVGLIFVLSFVLFSLLTQDQNNKATPLPNSSKSLTSQGLRQPSTVAGASQILRAYQDHDSKIIASSYGHVVKILPDDLKGSRHQKFILRLNNDLTLLVSHNIDLAPRIEGLRKNDRVEFFGEYEWNERGGVIHWTHHDPNKAHPDGWLKHDGRIYK